MQKWGGDPPPSHKPYFAQVNFLLDIVTRHVICETCLFDVVVAVVAGSASVVIFLYFITHISKWCKVTHISFWDISRTTMRYVYDDHN